MYKILVIEDDEALCAQICERLEKWEFETTRVQDFKNIVSEYIRIKPNLIVMDVTLPYFHGFYWCNKIRDISSVPIIFASSRDSNMDIIMAINMGGDDYVTKPFSIDILIAKITALLRRSSSDLLNCFTKMNEQFKTTIIMVTHDAFAASYCKRILFIKDGKIYARLDKNKDRKEFFKRILDFLISMGGGESELL